MRIGMIGWEDGRQHDPRLIEKVTKWSASTSALKHELRSHPTERHGLEPRGAGRELSAPRVPG